MPCEKSCKTRCYSRPYIHVHPAVIAFFSPKPCKKLFSPATCTYRRECANQKKTGPVKKRMASWARQRQQITEAADGGAGAGCSRSLAGRPQAQVGVVVLWVSCPSACESSRRPPGRAAGSARRHHPPPCEPGHPKGPDYILLRNGQKKLVRSLQGGEHRPSWQGLPPRQVLRVPGPRAGDHPAGGAAGGTRAAQRLAAGELGGPQGTRRTLEAVARVRHRWRPCCTQAAPSSLGRDLLDPGHGWSAPRARATGTPGRRWRRSCASA